MFNFGNCLLLLGILQNVIFLKTFDIILYAILFTQNYTSYLILLQYILECVMATACTCITSKHRHHLADCVRGVICIINPFDFSMKHV